MKKQQDKISGEPRVIYEDEFMIAVAKPPFMPSVSLKENESGTLASWLIKRFPNQKELPNGALEAGLLHRLDNETSGIILAAKTKDAFEKFGSQIGDKAKKKYLALVVGFAPDEMTISKPIAHHPRKKKKMVVCESAEKAKQLKARDAKTLCRVLKRFRIKGLSFSLVQAEIQKGLRHQIRAHLAGEGFPICGDEVYENKNRKEEDLIRTERHLLHAHSIEFHHPFKNKKIRLFAPLEGGFRKAVLWLASTHNHI